jgi:hypothetical protein
VITPAETQPQLSNKVEKIVSRHWHDPLDNGILAAVQPSSKRKQAKASTNRSRVTSPKTVPPTLLRDTNFYHDNCREADQTK